MKISPRISLLILILATFISYIIANLPTGKDPGLGGFLLMLWPPILGIIGIIIYLIICAVTKNNLIRTGISITWALYLIYVGVGLHIDKGWPLIYW